MMNNFHAAGANDSSLQQRNAHYGALNLVSEAVWIFDIDLARVHWANTAALQVWKATSPQELCSRDLRADMSDSVARRLAQYQRDFIEHGASFNEQWTLYPGGAPVALHVNFSGHRLDDGRMAMLCQGHPVGVLSPGSPESLRSVEALLHTAVMITLYGENGEPLYRNPAARASFRGLEERLPDRITHRPACEVLLERIKAEQVATCTLEVNTAQGGRWHEISVRRCRDGVTGQHALLVSEVDVSALKQTEAQANFMALHDLLTGLPNRAHVVRRFFDHAGQMRPVGQEAALIFLDLDLFKNVNDTLGHVAGDELLVEVARRLRGAVRSTDLVARLGGDEFLLLLVAKDIRAEVDRVRQRIEASIAKPIFLAGSEVCITATMGVSLYPQDGNDIDTLMRHADLAMYTAKDSGRNHLAYFEAGMGVALRERTALEADLRLAVERNEFEVHYQPRVCVRSGAIVGAEALIRWRHPQRGLVRPDLFIPACENNGLIQRIGLQVFESAVKQRALWARKGHDLQVSVNLSPRQFADPDLLADMQRVLTAHPGCREKMEVEITESMLLATDNARPAEVLGALRALGLSIALDDFGTGYSNLAYLRRYPIQTLKIDKTFIHGLQTDRPLAELIVAMCRLMHLKIVAEGVETQEQLAWVAENRIEQYQGYLFAPALTVSQFDALLDLPAPAVAVAEAASTPETQSALISQL